MNTNQPQDVSEASFDIVILFRLLMGNLKTLILITSLFAVTSIIVALLIPNTFRSGVLLAPAADESSNLAGLASRFGGLASLAGINLGGLGKNNLPNSDLALEIMKSRAFLGNFITQHNLAVKLVAVSHWDEETNQLVIDPDIYNEATATWVRDVGPPLKTIPTIEELHERFLNRLTINEDDETGLIRVAITYYSPHEAKRWVDLLLKDLNEYMRQRDIKEAEDSIKYLEQQISKTNLAKMQEVFYQLIEQQTQQVMLAKIRSEYVFTTVDPAVVPEKRYSPKRAIIVILSTFLGGLVAIAFVLLRERFKEFQFIR
jgi:uncharacterized protein involved in exopolysaccharide biosynthesis